MENHLLCWSPFKHLRRDRKLYITGKYSYVFVIHAELSYDFTQLKWTIFMEFLGLLL